MLKISSLLMCLYIQPVNIIVIFNILYTHQCFIHTARGDTPPPRVQFHHATT